MCLYFNDSMFYLFFFFFSSRRRHTRYWRDWSSDVCSSDLEVPHVRGPVAVPPGGRERHRLGLTRRGLGLLQSVELAVERQDAPAGPGAEVDADLGQRRVDAELAEPGVLLEPPDGVHRRQGHLPHALGPAAAPVIEALRAFLDPPLERPVDGVAVDLEVPGDGLDGPPFGVEPHHGQPPLPWLGDLVVGRVAADHAQRQRLLLEDLLDRVTARSPPEARVADLRDLVEAEGRVFGLEVHDEAPQSGWQPPVLGRRL